MRRNNDEDERVRRGVPAGRWNLLLRSMAIILFSSALTIFAGATHAQQKAFEIAGVPVVLEEVGDDVGVRFEAMRFNRAADVWNVDAVLVHGGSGVLRGPFVVLFEGVEGSELLEFDGEDPGGARYLDLSSQVTGGVLGPGTESRRRTLSLSRGDNAPRLTARVYARRAATDFAVALARSLDDAGHPLTGVVVEEMTAGTARTLEPSDPDGIVTLGGEVGVHTWRFERAGYLPAWRRAELRDGEVALLPNPRLSPVGDRETTFSPVTNGRLTGRTGAIDLRFDAGTFSQISNGRLTELTGQRLPALLPLGWSPMAAFWLELDFEPRTPGVVTVRPSGPIQPDENAVLVLWDGSDFAWEIAEIAAGNGAEPVTFSLDQSGAYALVVADRGVTAPPAPIAGERLLGSSEPFTGEAYEGMTAEGTVNPAVSAASRDAARVTATARVVVRHPTNPLPSGVVLVGEVRERYLLQEGALRAPPRYETHLIGYQRPGDADPNTLNLSFPMRPMLLLGAEELVEATVRVDVAVPEPFDGEVIGADGGQLTAGAVQLLAGSGVYSGPQAVRLRDLGLDDFAGLATGIGVAVAGFELSAPQAAEGRGFLVRVEGQAGSSNFVLGRVVSRDGMYGVEPVERLSSDSLGRLASVEPVQGPRLSGVRGGGQFLLIRVDHPQGLIAGVARNASGQALPGMAVEVTGTRWLTFSGENGAYRLVAPAGQAALLVRDPTNGDTGSAQVALQNAQSVVEPTVETVPTGPWVADIEPRGGAMGVSRVSPVTVRFSEPVSPTSLGAAGIQLIAPGEVLVPASLSLNLRNTVATLLPVEELAPATRYMIRLSSAITDLTQLPVTGALEFEFETAALPLRGAGAQLVIYEPGAMNVPEAVIDQIAGYEAGSDPDAIVVEGSQGSADPEVPVILVNESTGETSTVLSKPDGSFYGLISGGEEDYVSATFINANNTRIYIPVSKQMFDNGFVGLYRQGGILEAESDGGPVQVIVEPGAVRNKSKFRLNLVEATQLLALLEETPPEAGELVGPALELEYDGDGFNGDVDIDFPVPAEQLKLEAGQAPEETAFALVVPVRMNGEVTYMFVNKMRWEDGRLFTNTEPDPGPDWVTENAQALFSTAELMGFIVDPIGSAIGAIAMAPIQMLERGLPGTFTGRVLEASFDDDGQAMVRPVGGAVVTVRPVTAGLFSSARPGRLDPGTVFGVSRRNGVYSLMLPQGELFGQNAFALTATHPKYFRNRVAKSATPFLATISKTDLVFSFPAGVVPDPLAPRVSVSHRPFRPAPGSTAELQILAIHRSDAPDVNIELESVTSLVANVVASEEDVTLGEAVEEAVGEFGKRVTLPVTCTSSSRVTLKISVFADGAPPTEMTTSLLFGGEDIIGDNPSSSDQSDTVPPQVIRTEPASHASALSQGEPIRIHFNEAIDNAIVGNLDAVQLTPPAGNPVLTLSDDQRTLSILYYDLNPAEDQYTLTLTQEIRDISPNSNPMAQDFVLSFRLAPVTPVSLPGVDNGGGMVTSGVYAYALERGGDLDGGLLVYDLSDPQAPVKVGQVSVPPTPRDLALIPNYSFRLRHDDFDHRTSDLIAVVGGRVGGSVDRFGNVVGGGHYLWVIDVSTPAQPKRIASAVISLANTAIVDRVDYSHGVVAYVEFGADLHFVGLVDLQMLIVSSNIDRDEFLPQEDPGLDANADGDYVDPGDSMPRPGVARSDFSGKILNLLVANSDQPIRDISLDWGNRYVGAVLGSGTVAEFGENVQPVGPGYMTLFKGLVLDPGEGFLDLADHRMKRVKGVFGVPLESEIGVVLSDLALVSAVDVDGKSVVIAVDITDPTHPQELSRIHLVTGLGIVQSITEREDGMLLVATQHDLLLLDPTRLAMPAGGTEVHPALVGRLPGLGSGARTFAGDDVIFAGTNLGGKNVVAQTPPQVSFVRFLGEAPFAPGSIPVDPLALDALFDKLSFETSVNQARYRGVEGSVESNLLPPSDKTHYYVLVNAPGSAGEQIDLYLESLNRAAHPLKNLGRGFPPVRAAHGDTVTALDQEPRPDCDAEIVSLQAKRLSADKRSRFYNLYLTKPIALIGEKVFDEDMTMIYEGLDRAVLWSGAFVRAGIDPSMELNPVLGRYAARVNDAETVIHPGVAVLAESLHCPYIMGSNPPPNGGTVSAPGSFGVVSVHNGELRTDTIDIHLPGRRLPIIFQRTLGGQDQYDGPFGRGWDFNYNQRVIELKPNVFPVGSEAPLILRDPPEDSVVALSRDVLFMSGQGRIIRFSHRGEERPDELDNDPLVDLFATDVAAYYLPERDVSDILAKFKDGKFMRLTADGGEFWYSSGGRLESIYDRFKANHHELSYNQRGDLIKVTDRSVESDRFLELGYWRLEGDAAFVNDLDRITDNTFIAGKICRIKDYVERDLLFYYDEDGVLLRREGIEVDGPEFSGRPTTSYLWDGDCDFSGIVNGAGGGDDGTPLFVATLEKDEGNKQAQASDGSGAAGGIGLTLPETNSADSNEDAVIEVNGLAGDLTKFILDPWGYPSNIEMSGEDGETASYQLEHNDIGLLKKVTYPEGNTVEYTYAFEAGEVPWRARGNLMTIKRSAGPRDAEPAMVTASFAGYDHRYNLPVGNFTDENSNALTYALTEDGKEIESIDYPGVGKHSFQYNEFGQAERESFPDGLVKTWGYDDSTGFATSEGSGGVMTGLDYGGGTVAEKLGMPGMVTLPSGSPIVNAYDNRLQLVSVSRGSSATTYDYDANGNVRRIKETVGDGATVETELVYNQVNFLEKSIIKGVEVDGDGSQDLETVYVPDEAHRVKELKLPGNRTQTFGYDHRGFLVSMTIGDYAESYMRDKHGNITELKVGEDVINSIQYDGFDRPIMIRDETGGETADITHLTYFPDGTLKSRMLTDPMDGVVHGFTVNELDSFRRPREITYAGTSIAPSVEFVYASEEATGGSMTVTGPRNVEVLEYDATGRVTRDANGLSDIQYHYGAGLRVSMVEMKEDGESYFSNYGYNDLDQVISRDDPIGPLYTYEPRFDGRVEKIIDARMNAIEQQFTRLGEVKRRELPSGAIIHQRYDAARRLSFVGGEAGFSHQYEESGRLSSSTLPGGGDSVHSSPDARLNPEEVTIPGGSSNRTYDLQSRLTSSMISFDETGYQTGFIYDARNRVRMAVYGTADEQNAASFVYDAFGPMLSAVYEENGNSFSVSYELYEDGARKSVTYPSTVMVEEDREPSGRLIGVTPSEGPPVIRIDEFAGAELPKTSHLGGSVIRVDNEFDARKRLRSRRYTRTEDGAVLVDLRYEYDAADNPVAIQHVHRAGRADLFAFDPGNRLDAAHIGARVPMAEEVLDGAIDLEPEREGFVPGWYSRGYVYEAATDTLIDLPASLNETTPPPPFAESMSDYNTGLFAETVDGLTRTSDALHNTAETRVLPRPANASEPVPQIGTLSHNGASRLERVVREDGTVIEYAYQFHGLMHRRRVTGPADDFAEFAYVWENGRLIEAYRVVEDEPELTARYFYGDEDFPTAAEIRDAGGMLRRYFYLHDNLGSVVAVADASGQVVERVVYDPFGQAVIEGADARAPVVNRIEMHPDGLLIVFSEPITTPLDGAGGGTEFVTSRRELTEAFILTDTDASGGGENVIVEFDPHREGYSQGTSVLLQVDLDVDANLILDVEPDSITDEWGNIADAETIALTYSGPPASALYERNPIADTRPERLARSSIGSPFLFQGQFTDDETGLVYMRQRWYDPFTGQFLEPDSVPFLNSVNLYAGLGHNPLRFRDPSGAVPLPVSKGVTAGGRVKPIPKTYRKATPSGSILVDSELAGAVKLLPDNALTRSKRLGSNVAPKRQNAAQQISKSRVRSKTTARDADGNAPSQARRASDEISDQDVDNVFTKSSDGIRTNKQPKADDAFESAPTQITNREDLLAARARWNREAGVDFQERQTFFSKSDDARTAFNREIIAESKPAGWVDLSMHGGTDGRVAVSVYKDGKVKATYFVEFHKIAEVLVNRGYSGQPIRLLTCHGGVSDNGLARYLSQVFDTEVLGASTRVHASPRKGVYLHSGESIGSLPAAQFKPDGHWIRFVNGARGDAIIP